MELKLTKMTKELAKKAIDWKYEGEYSVYNNPPYEEMVEKKYALVTPKKYGKFICFLNENDEFVGYTKTYEKEDKTFVGIALSPEFVGKGLGKDILEKTLEELANKKIFDVYVEVRSWNERAIKCYQKVGFKITGTKLQIDHNWKEVEYTYMEYKTPRPKKRKWWYRCLKRMMRGRYKKPEFIYLGEKISHGAIILSNHEGTDAPMSLEIYGQFPTRMWGAHEMNSGLIKMYKYQTRVYYHEKKHWNLHLARLFCLIASPLTNLFYKGLGLISSYKDARFIKTIRESITSIKEGDNIVIYPEDSSKGYLEQLEGFYKGFITLAEKCLKEGINVPIYVSYFRKKDLKYIIDKPVLYASLKEKYESTEEIAKVLCERCNELGQMFQEDK